MPRPTVLSADRQPDRNADQDGSDQRGEHAAEAGGKMLQQRRIDITRRARPSTNFAATACGDGRKTGETSCSSRRNRPDEQRKRNGDGADQRARKSSAAGAAAPHRARPGLAGCERAVQSSDDKRHASSPSKIASDSSARAATKAGSP